jgi:single-strand DNA-binding protein
MNNNYLMIGRITKDLELNSNDNGKFNTKLTLAVQNGKEDTSFIEMVAFNDTAKTLCDYCKKGDLIATKGIVKNNNWEDAKGNKHYDYSFIIRQISFLNIGNKKETTNPYEEFGEQVNINDSFLD